MFEELQGFDIKIFQPYETGDKVEGDWLGKGDQVRFVSLLFHTFAMVFQSCSKVKVKNVLLFVN